MGKYEQLISDAKVAISDVMMTLNGADIAAPLKANMYMRQMKEDMKILVESKGGSVFSRIKDVMLDSEEDRKKSAAEQSITDNIYQLNNCLKCRCLNCAKMDSNCTCEGCLFGSFVVDCDQTTETREADRDVLRVNRQVIVKMEFDRRNKQAVMTTVNNAGLQEKSLYDFSSSR